MQGDRGRKRKAMTNCLSGAQTQAGDLLQIIFVFKQPDELEFDALDIEQWADVRDDDQIVYVIHAMPLTHAMKKQFRRRTR